jgi:hypothetical protein
MYDMRPDGAFDLESPHGEAAFYLEFDTGTEPLTRLIAKARYFGEKANRELERGRGRVETARHSQSHSASSDPSWFMLIEMTKSGREDNFHQRLAGSGERLPVATTLVDRAANPLGPVWRLCGAPARVLRRLDGLHVLH